MQTIDAAKLEAMKGRNDFILLNVLSEEAFREEHIPGSTNIPVEQDDFEQQVQQLAGDKDRTVVVYCASTECPASATAAKKLEAAGFTNVIDFEGGMAEWDQANRPVETGGA